MDGKRIYKSKDDVVLSGVLGGLAEYLDTDPVLVRFTFVLIFLAGGGGVLLILYIVATFIVPEKPKKQTKSKKFNID
jgi:phage shock protein C